MGSHDASLLDSTDAGDIEQLLKLHVRDAVRSRLQKSTKRSLAYFNLVEQVRRIKEAALRARDEEQTEHLTSVIDALTACASSLHEREHEGLLREVLDIPLWAASPDVRAALLRLVTHLVVANSALVPLCLRVLAAGLQPPPAPPSAAEAAAAEQWEPSAEAVGIQDEVVTALEKVLTLVPTAPARLVSALASGAPHRLRDARAHALYLRGVLTLAERPAAAATVREGVLAAVAEHLLGLDVEIRWQDIAAAEADAAEEEGESDHEDIFELEGQTEQLHIGTPGAPDEAAAAQEEERARGRGGWEGAACGAAAAAAASPGQVAATTEMADKLDALMGLVFAHLSRRCEAGQLGEAWGTLLGAFERSILHTHRSKFTQFLLWFLADKEPAACSSAFITLLLARLTSPNTAPITRAAAAAYVASFLARAAYVPDEMLVHSLQALGGWCLGFCRDADARARAAQSPAAAAPSTRLDADAAPAKDQQYQVFYAACQGLLYVLCYRMDHLMAPVAATQQQHAPRSSPESVGGGGHVPALRQLFSEVMPQLLNHRLAPLSACLPTVVTEFGRLCARLGLMDCGGLLPRARAAQRQQRPLEMFFPFDPFLLRRSAQYLDLGRTYVHWKAGHPRAGADGAPEADAASDASSEEGIDAASQSDGEAQAEASEDEDASSAEEEEADSSDEEEESAGAVGRSADAASSAASLPPGHSPNQAQQPGQQHQQQQRRRPPRQRISGSLEGTPAVQGWPHAPLGTRPISAGGGASRKRAASSTPGSDQGYLHGTSLDMNGMHTPEGMSPGASPPGMNAAPMSWQQQNGNSNPALLLSRATMQLPVDA